MTRKRSTAKPDTGSNAEAPISGVAGGSLGTAANLDDTQVLRTEDLQAAAAKFDADSSSQAAEPGPAPATAVPVAPVAARAVAPRGRREAPAATPRQFGARRAGTRPARASAAAAIGPVARWNPSRAALAGVAAFVVLLLIAGAGFFSQLDLGMGVGQGGESSSNALLEAPAPTADATKQPTSGGHGKCHGKGHGGNCQGNED